MAPPRLWVSQTRIFRTATFEVCIAARAAWLESNAVTPDAVWKSGRNAVLLNCLENRTLEPCPRCCVPISKPNVSVECSSTTPTPAQQGDELVFVFDEFCNSSRLHLGGKVVLLVEIADARGAVVCRLHSDRLLLCSKSSFHALSSPSPAPQQQQSTEEEEEEIPLSFSPLFAGFATPWAAEPPAPAPEPPGGQAEHTPGASEQAREQQAAGGAAPDPVLIARHMGELETMRQENLARVLLLQHLLVLALTGSRPP
eukprot:m51a1_g13125 hypothetical protein (256) ;mRNA; r:1390-2550